jgi:hypothetical protein
MSVCSLSDWKFDLSASRFIQNLAHSIFSFAHGDFQGTYGDIDAIISEDQGSVGGCELGVRHDDGLIPSVSLVLQFPNLLNSE